MTDETIVEETWASIASSALRYLETTQVLLQDDLLSDKQRAEILIVETIKEIEEQNRFINSGLNRLSTSSNKYAIAFNNQQFLAQQNIESLQYLLTNDLFPDWSEKSATLVTAEFGKLVGELGGYAIDVVQYFTKISESDYLGAIGIVAGAIIGGVVAGAMLAQGIGLTYVVVGGLGASTLIERAVSTDVGNSIFSYTVNKLADFLQNIDDSIFDALEINNKLGNV